MVLPITFAGLSTALMSDLDVNFAALGNLSIISCTIAGTNDLVLTPEVNAPTVAAYHRLQCFSGVASITNTGPVTARVGTLGSHPVYMDTLAGPVLLSNHEIVAGNFVLLVFDIALNSGAGGFRLITPVTDPVPVIGGTPATVSSATGTTLTAAQLTGGGYTQAIILRSGTSGDFNDTTDTGANIVAAIPGCAVDTYFHLRMINSSGHTQTLLAGSGVTVTGTATTATSTTHDFIGVVTAIGTPAVTIYG